MNLYSIVLIAVALAMDALAVSIASGIILKKSKLKHAVRIAFFFGIFQLFMPLIGAVAGTFIKDFMSRFDHWIIFVILTAIGGKMIYEAFKLKEDEEKFDPTNLKTLIFLSIATSIDALAVGVSLSLLSASIYLAVSIIGIVTFILCFTGVMIGDFIGHFFEEKIEALGGLILIGIGIKIL
ncbi:MAG: manganese efflux pump MntP family protein, partial [Lentisphaerae bacterium]|nr:manganese efflux pump MntP family protein [Lentisphaerota bacterium]